MKKWLLIIFLIILANSAYADHSHFDTEKGKSGVVISRSYRIQAEIDEDWGGKDVGGPNAAYYHSGIDGGVIQIIPGISHASSAHLKHSFSSVSGDIWTQWEMRIPQDLLDDGPFSTWHSMKIFRVFNEGKVGCTDRRIETMQLDTVDGDITLIGDGCSTQQKEVYHVPGDTWVRYTWRFNLDSNQMSLWTTTMDGTSDLRVDYQVSGWTSEGVDAAAPKFHSTSRGRDGSGDQAKTYLLGYRNIIVSTKPIAFDSSSSCSTDDDCDDNNFCNGVETCSGTCQSGTPIDSDDGVACTIDSCNITTGQVTNTPDDSQCQDSNQCTTNEKCDLSLGCTFDNTASGTSCDDSKSCTSVDSCDGAGTCSGILITACANGDGCCPSGCEELSDDDCSSVSCDNLQALFHLNNDATDSSGKGNDGTVNGATPTTGKYDGAYNFDGSNDYIDLNNLDISGNEITISAWINADSYKSEGSRIISKASSSDEADHYWMLGTIPDSGTKLRFRLKTGGTTSTLIANSGDLTTGQWIHTVAVYDGTEMRLYKDGILIGSKSKTGTINTNPLIETNIGANPGTYGLFNGLIDEVIIWNRPLTNQEIQDLFNKNSKLTCNSYHKADKNKNGCIELTEITTFLTEWKNNLATIIEIVDAIKIWKGCS